MTIHTVNLEITTHCNMRCPNCCVGIGINRFLQHHPLAYFEKAATALHGIERVNVIGGEPTIHPKFAELSEMFKAMFQCKTLTLATNGHGIDHHAGTILVNYDEVYYTHYTDIDLAAVIRGRIIIHDEYVEHTPRSREGSGKPCCRACWRSGGIAYADGKIWGCCIAQGLSGAIGIEGTPDWEREVLSTPLPCATCFFSE